MGPQSAKFNAAIFYGPLICGALLSLNFRVQLALIFIVGFVLFFRAKISILKKGNWVSFGAREMTPEMKKLYYLGYLIMISATAVSLLFLFLEKEIF
tara:strand:+ start:7039 stop:7329 length:291 start_codon:yes stop_codon:yes gene_type:complete